MGQTGPREIGANLAFGVNLALFILQCKSLSGHFFFALINGEILVSYADELESKLESKLFQFQHVSKIFHLLSVPALCEQLHDRLVSI